MRSLSFRSLFLLLMVTPVVVATAVLGGLSYRAASEVLTQDAMRAVRISADAREQALLARLFRQRERAMGFLTLTRQECAALPGAERHTCFQEALSDFMITEGAVGARLRGGVAGAVAAGQPSALEPLEPLPSRQWVRVEPKGDGRRFYELVLPSGELLLGMRFDSSAIDPLFQEHSELGTSGETFLADAQGFFITPPKYPGHSGESHPIDARPMLACLAGRDEEMLAPDYRPVDVIHAFRHIEEIGGGCIMAHIAQEEAFAPASRLRGRVASVSLALVLLTTGLAFVFSRHLSRPMRRLTRTARALRSGDFEVVVPEAGPRELRTFATTFSQMARSLKDSTEERSRLLTLETQARELAESRDAERARLLREVDAERERLGVLAGLSRALAESPATLDALLDTTCRQLAERVGDVCILRLLTEDGRSLEARAVYARDPRIQARTRALLEAQPQRSHEGISGRVLASGAPLLLSPLDTEALGTILDALPAAYQDFLRELSPRCLAILPVRAADRSLGLLTLYRTTPPCYAPDDLVLFREVSDRTALAVENARLLQSSRDAVRLRDDLVAVVSHDLRNPISAISLSATSLLKREGLADWQQRGVGRIASSAERALRMIRDLLESTQARVSGIPVALGPVEFHALARHVVEEVQLAHPSRRILFHAEGEGQGEGDADRMAQVITNLVGNAVQHSPESSPVSVRSRGLEDALLLSIHNEGAPIPGEDLATLFEPFRRGRSAGGGAPGSVGLGLFITRRIVEAHGGSIEVRSREGEGTTFTVRLPRSRPKGT